MGATLAVIGLGRIGAFHAETLSGLAGGRTRRHRRTTRGHGRCGRTARRPSGARQQAALAAGVDGVVIAAATPAHARLILAAVDAGIPVFCEKPIASTVAESRDIVSRLTDSIVPVQIGYNRRFDPACVAAYEAVRAGELGRLTTVRSTTMDPAPPPPAYVAVSGGIFRDCSVHDFDIVRWIVGREVVEVYATGTDHGEAMFAEAGDVATAQTLHVRRRHAGGGVEHPLQRARPRLPTGIARQRRHRRRRLGLECAGTQPRTRRNFSAPRPAPVLHGPLREAYRAELGAFLDVAMGRRASPCPPEEALEVAWIAEAATLSLHQHRPIRMDEVRS